MGDFNDNPNNNSVTLMEKESQLYNPFKTVWSYNKGSLSYNFRWNLFDQILFSTNFFDATGSALAFDNANVFNSKILTQSHGKYKGQPFRTYVGKKYKEAIAIIFPFMSILRFLKNLFLIMLLRLKILKTVRYSTKYKPEHYRYLLLRPS